MSKEKRLGRGLEALLGRVPEAPAESPDGVPKPHIPAAPGTEAPYGNSVEQLYEIPDQPAETKPVTRKLHGPVHSTGIPISDLPKPGDELDVDRIDPNPFQPREQFDDAEIAALADSLKSHGLLQPLIVRKAGERYQLVAGERRLRAAKEAGWKRVPVRIIEADEREMAELAIVENLQRKDLNPLEKAASFRRYLQEYNATQDELAARLNIDRSTVANLIRLLDLPEPLQEALRQNRLTQGHARALLGLPTAEEQIEAGKYVEQEGLSVRKTEALVQAWLRGERPGTSPSNPSPKKPAAVATVPGDHLAALEQEFRRALGSKVKLVHNGNGRGKIVISFRSHEEFERLRDYICGPLDEET
ncbi:MAG: ParB/RepB/Spo0J family partition protein [Planctomycetota bacterium]|nr:MAG: ParB/RepB/Spo0J family partition protein [Planctomycetota bacterium]